MRIAVCLSALVLVCLVLSGCAGFVLAPVVPPPAVIYTSYTAPLDCNFDRTAVADARKGEKGIVNILGLFTFGDAGSMDAAKEGNLSRVDGADYTMLNVLGVFSRYSTVVYGE